MSRTHGLASTYRHGCRCEDCRTAHTIQAAAERARRAERSRDEVPHGTFGGYVNWACRCDPCSEANSAKCADYQARIKAAGS
jgi:hypothetical protein